MESHRCGWTEIRQHPSAWPAPDHLFGLVEGLLSDDLTPAERAAGFLAAAIGFFAGFVLGFIGIARRWSPSQAVWGFASLLGRLSRGFGSDPNVAEVLTAALTAGCIAAGGQLRFAGVIPPLANVVARSAWRPAEYVKRRLRARVEAGWVMGAGFAFGLIASNLSRWPAEGVT